MGHETDEPNRERHLVVVFDICSSTTILEDLKRTDNLGAWRKLLITLKDHVLETGTPLGMDLYKFIGDGWVLLFPNSVPKMGLCTFLGDLSKKFEVQFEASIKPLLSQEPSPVGLMFGIDAGELIRMVLGNQVEFVGRAINVASRLQSYTKELPGGPSYKVIFSKNSFNSPAPPPAGLTVDSIKVSLRNISPPTMQCFVWDATDPRLGDFAATALAIPAARSKPVLTEPPPPVTSKTKTGSVTKTRTVLAAELAKPARTETQRPAAVAKRGSGIKVVGTEAIQIAALGGVGKWMAHRAGQPGLVVQFAKDATKGAQPSTGTLAHAHLIYRAGDKELLRVRGAWLDAFDVVKFHGNETRSLIVGVCGSSGFSALEAVRSTVKGSERVEIRPSHFDRIPPKLSVLVQLTEADKGALLYEGEFEIATNPLSITTVP
ncbi:MAG TPA: hypothetical protein VEJ38_16560 [Candidatus Acidoferrales bacterium]|nr:hypothetical protein [Candidatus Acidoferrales bacterium]